MLNSIKLVFVLIFCFGISAFAADPAFIVFYNSGKAIKKANGKTIVLKKGDHLLPTDIISVPAKTQLVLLCANFITMQLKTERTATVASLQAQCKTKTTSASSAYFKYVWDQFSHPHKSPDKDPRSYMQNVGAAVRGGVYTTWLNTDTIYYHSGKLNIGWQPNKMAVLNFLDINERPLISTKASITLKLDSIAGILTNPGTYLWTFKDVQNLKTKRLVILDKKEYEQLKKSIMANVIATTPAETAYLTGYLFEEKHFLADAAKYYEKAVKLVPDNQIYKAASAKFKP